MQKSSPMSLASQLAESFCQHHCCRNEMVECKATDKNDICICSEFALVAVERLNKILTEREKELLQNAA